MQSDLDYIMRSFSLSRTKAEGVKLGKPQSIHRNHRFDAPWLRSERSPFNSSNRPLINPAWVTVGLPIRIGRTSSDCPRDRIFVGATHPLTSSPPLGGEANRGW